MYEKMSPKLKLDFFTLFYKPKGKIKPLVFQGLYETF